VSYFTRLTSVPLHDHLGVITFYSAQVHQIKKSLRSCTAGGSVAASSRIHVMSVDGFQGSEKDIIIVSFVRCNDHSEVGFVNDFQRLNVSLTRAKYLLILVGCLRTLEESNSVELQNLVHDAKARKRVCSYDTFDRNCK
jgi:superfamily I DNA and/or RNA helicase